MKKLLNTLYVMNPDYCISLENEAVKVSCDDAVIGRFPLHNFESIITHGVRGISSALMEKCANENISICMMSRAGRFQARILGPVNGNVLLRKEQYRVSDSEDRSIKIAKNCIYAKIHNSRWLIDRYCRDHAMSVNDEALNVVIHHLKSKYQDILHVNSLDSLRGIEGELAQKYFSIFNELILSQKNEFAFNGRTRRPPKDLVNAMLSYLYTILTHDMASALEAVGLDPYVGFLHQDRPGRESLALDLIEELRSVMVDRAVLTAINRREIKPSDFLVREDGAVQLTENGRKVILSLWQNKKQETIMHPFLKEKISWGLIPYSQALLLARHIRGDIEEYPPFLCRI